LIKELQEKLQERQRAIRLFYSAIKNAQEFKVLDTDSEEITNELLAPSVYGNSNIPEVFEHMIEDESYNDFGQDSGTRYIIKRAQIKSIDIAENPPDNTMVEVQGVLNVFASGALPEGLNSFPNNGNGLVTALAVDYDMWRNYGFKNLATIKVPFLSDPNSQCAPYASMILSQARKNILRGTVTIAGNEFMQPGEVVYLQDRGLLFYVSSVRHNFTYGISFNTILDLTYGHTPGEYIPTTLDIIGKMIYNNRDIAGYTIHRQASATNETSMGSILLDPKNVDAQFIPNQTPKSELPPDTPNAPQSKFAVFNKQVIDNIIFQSAYLINANNSKGNNVVARLELRIYYDDNNAINSKLKNFAQEVLEVFTGKVDGPAGVNFSAAPNNSPLLSKDSIKIVEVNIDDDQETKSPSQKAIDSARNQLFNSAVAINLPNESSDTTTPPNSNDKLRAALFGYIVDCWLSFDTITASEGGS
jgi:hypothetical protein